MIAHSKPYTDSLELDAIKIALKENHLGKGIKTKELEALIGNTTGYPDAIAAASASYAIYLILTSIYPEGKAKVAVQSYVCRSVYDSIVMANCIPVVFDINYLTFGIDTSEVLKQHIDIVIITHLFGVRSDFSDLVNNGIPIIEDCAQRITPSNISEEPKSNWRVYSFEATKIITCGQGGAIVGSDEVKLNEIRSKTSGDYDFPNPCIVNTFSDIQASIAIEQWRKIDLFLSRRKEIAAFYIEELNRHHLENIIHPSMLYDDTWHFRFILEVKSPDKIINKMDEHGIACRKPVKPFGLHKLFNISGEFKFTDYSTEKLISLPLYPALTGNEQERVISTFITSIKKQ